MADKGKRALEANDKDELQPQPKRPRIPTLASVLAGAIIADPRLRSQFELTIRKVVREEFERAYANPGAAVIGGGRNWLKRIEGPDGRKLQLCFRTRLSTPLFSDDLVEGENRTAIRVMLLDAKSGQPVHSGPEASAKLDVVVLDGVFNKDDDDDWTEEEFQSHIVKEREGKRPLLVGDLQVSLKDGTGTLGKLSITDSACWTKTRKFRLGIMIASGCCQGVRMREAKTEAFSVLDRRGLLSKKNYPPALKDEVWRLEKIGKDGSFDKKLRQNEIKTVEDFLRCHVKNPAKLRKILGDGMKRKMWESLINHAKTCTLNDSYYIYYQDERKNAGAIFNVIYEFHSLTVDGQFYSAESLDGDQKDLAAALIKNAYKNWDHVVEYDGRELVKYVKNKKATESEKESLLASSNYPVYSQPVYQFHSQSSVALHQQHSHGIADAVEGGPMTAGVDGNQAAGNTHLTLNADLNPHMPTENPSFVPQNNSVGSTYQPHLRTNDSTQLGQEQIYLPSIISPFDQPMEDMYTCQGTFDDPFEYGMLQSSLSMDGASTSDHYYGFDLSSCMPVLPDFGLGDEWSHHTSGKAAVGWLKIKAAMRWGLFVRRKAMERRAAQLVELVDNIPAYGGV